MEFLGEAFELEDIKKFDGEDHRGWGKPTKEFAEINRHMEKHYNSLIDRLSNGDMITNKYNG